MPAESAPKLGQVIHDLLPDGTYNTHPLQGRVFELENITPNSAPGSAATRLTNHQIKAILVRNVSTVALLPGRVVQMKVANTTTAIMKEVGGYANTHAAPLCGIVDPNLPAAGVANKDLFLLIIAGPCYVRTPGTYTDMVSAIAVGDTVVSSAAGSSLTDADGGRIAKISFTTTTNDSTTNHSNLTTLIAEMKAFEAGVLGTSLSAVTYDSDGQNVLALINLNCRGLNTI